MSPRSFAKIEQALGPIEILVNNAGIGYFGPTHEAAEENWDTVLDTNLKSVFLLSKAVAPGMIRLRTAATSLISRRLRARARSRAAEFTAPRNGACWGSRSAWPRICGRTEFA